MDRAHRALRNQPGRRWEEIPCQVSPGVCVAYHLVMDRLFPPYRIEEYLEAKIEVKNLDYKLGVNWNKSSDERFEIVKDILAMANTQDGGTIIFGVRNEDFTKVGLSDAEFASFDQTKVNDLLHEYTDPKFTCFVYKHDNIHGKKYVAINVPEFPEIPIICKKDANSSKNHKLILTRGQLYIRTDKATSVIIPGAQEMRELLGRAITRKSDDLLSSIASLIKGRPPKLSDDAGQRYAEERREADGFLESRLGENLTHLGSWEVNAYPTNYRSDRIPNHAAIKEYITHATVHLRGWSFPQTSNDHTTNFSTGRQSFTIGLVNAEGYRAYQSGLFAWKGSFWEDKRGLKNDDGRNVLVFADVIYCVTEYILFLKRYYELVAPKDAIHVQIVMNGTNERKLVRGEYVSTSLPDSYIAKENPIVIHEDVQVVELKASANELAQKIIKRIFTLFNWEEASEAMIDMWQRIFLGRS